MDGSLSCSWRDVSIDLGIGSLTVGGPKYTKNVSSTRALWQFFTTTVIVVGIIVAFGAWYLLVAIASIIAIVAGFIYRSRTSKRAITSLAPIESGFVTQTQNHVIAKSGELKSRDQIYLRVVNTSQFSLNHSWLSSLLQVEGEETLEIDGALLASVKSMSDDDVTAHEEVVYVVYLDRALGELARVDLQSWFGTILESGGALRCKLRVSFNSSSKLERINVLGSLVSGRNEHL